MRALLLTLGMTYPTTAITGTSTPILLVAAAIGSVFAGDEAVPGEDMGFPSSGTAVVEVSLEAVTSVAGDTINVQVSNNYYLDSGSGETFTTVATITPGGLGANSWRSYFLDRVPLGEAMRLSITATGTTGLGKVSAYLLNN